MKKIIYTKKAPQPIGPYSQAVFANNVLYTSGQIAINAQTGNLENNTIEEETHVVMKNLKEVLSEANLNFSHVVKCTIFLKDMNQFGSVNGVYAQYFDENPPARETVQVARLPKDANVEISAIAVSN